MKLSTYKPNLSDKRVQAKLQTTLEWCSFHLDSKPRSFSCERIVEVFGPYHHNLTRWLKANLLVQEGTYSVLAQKTYDYSLNQAGFDKLSILLKSSLIPGKCAILEEKHAIELATGQYDYNFKSNRFWHPLQRIRRHHKQAFWTRQGYLYNYDLEAAAPTILIQLALKAGMTYLDAEPVLHYIKNKRAFRQRIAALANVPLHDAKSLITSLFNGARLVANHNVAAFRIVEDVEDMHRLRADPEVDDLLSAIKRMWVAISTTRTTPIITGSDKWAVYFEQEARVLEVAKRYMTRKGLSFFTEHDGWRCDGQMRVDEMQQEVFLETGLKVSIEEEIYEERDERDMREMTLAISGADKLLSDTSCVRLLSDTSSPSTSGDDGDDYITRTFTKTP